MKLLLYLCILVLPNSCLLLETPVGRIIGGEEVTPHTYQFQVGLFINTIINSQYFCGGTLISSQYVLTAAHCLELNVSTIDVYLGSHYITEKEEEHRTVLTSTQFIIHPDYNGNQLEHNIALVQLPRNVTLNEHNIASVRFATGNDTYASRQATMIGWGSTETSTTISPVLRHVTSTVLTNQACDGAFGGGVITTGNICADGAGPVGTCSGDSGGPLIVDAVQVGIRTYGSTNCVGHFPSVFTRITEYEDWLKQYVPDGSDSINSLHYSVVISAVLCLYQLFMYT